MRAEEKKMYKNKNVLLIAGGGTLGTYTAEELLRLGANVDVVCPEEKVSYDEHLHFYQSYATDEFLKELFSKKYYDGIVNFMLYPDSEIYKPIHKFLTDNTGHLIFLSSYRVYADLEHPITEEAPMLLDVSDDEEFLAKEDYALSKARAEKFIRAQTDIKNWTIVRPVISFSERRFDIFTNNHVLKYTQKGETIYLPEIGRKLGAGLDWAGNTGKLIANLLFKEKAKGEAFTITSGQNLTWEEIADIYTDLIGTKFEWIDTDVWLSSPNYIQNSYWAAVYDRFYDRTIDNSKVLRVTGLIKDDFVSIREGLKIELDKVFKKEGGNKNRSNFSK